MDERYELMDGRVTLIHANSLHIPLKDESVDCCVTSPPYWGLRDYGSGKWEGGEAGCDHLAPDEAGQTNKHTSGQRTHAGRYSGPTCWKCGASRIDNQLGLEKTPEEYVHNLVQVFREVRRTLKDEGTLWLNLGDSYANDGKWGGSTSGKHASALHGHPVGRSKRTTGLKPKDLVGIPWMVAFALRADGWYLRSDIVWCLSGGTWLYARTQRGDMPVMVRDLRRLRPGTVKLWNGEKWTNVLGISRTKRSGREIEILLRSGERISCTETHKFPSNRGLLPASDLKVGDRLVARRLPEPEILKDCVIDEDAAWFAGLYVAEGSRSGDAIQIAGHSKEKYRWARLNFIARKFGGTITRTVSGNTMDIRLYGKVLHALIDVLVTGKTAKNKAFNPVVWRYSNRFIASMIDGYLSGDGSDQVQRWRLGFTRNYNLERDLRIACARLGYTLTLNMASTRYKGRKVPTFKGELRKSRSGHHNEKDRCEIVAIRKARCREVYDIGVEDEPHLFSLASGILTHNSKPNCMPESVKDRPTRSHEYIFLLSKSPKYYYDHEAIRELAVSTELKKFTDGGRDKQRGHGRRHAGFNGRYAERLAHEGVPKFRNKRDVWDVPTSPFRGAHFAVFPPKLIEPCILAGCPENGLVLDPFGGSGTTAKVAVENERRAVLLDLNYTEDPGSYLEIAKERILAPTKPQKAEKIVEIPEMPSLSLFIQLEMSA